MKRRTYAKKYFILVVGALCILTAAALLFFQPGIHIEGIKNKDLRTVHEKYEEISAAEENWLLRATEASDSPIKEDLKDNDLPYRKSEIRSSFRNLNAIVQEALNNKISLKELTSIFWYAPKLVTGTENLMETDSVIFVALNLLSDYEIESEAVHGFLDVAAEYFDLIRMCSYVAIGLLVLLGLLVLAAAVGHVCNKARGCKYVLLILVVLATVGGFVGLPILSNNLQELLKNVALAKNISLHLTFIPIVSGILLLIPVILDGFTKKLEKELLANEETIRSNAYAVNAVQVQIPENTATIEETIKNISKETQIMSCSNEENITKNIPVMPYEPVEAETQEQNTQSYSEPAAKSAAGETVKGLLAKIKTVAQKVSAKKLFLAVGGAAIVAIVALVLSLVFSNTYKTPVRIMEQLRNSKNYVSTMELSTKYFNGFLKKETREIIKILEESDDYMDMIEDAQEDFNDSVEDLKFEYGKNYKYNYKIIDKEVLEKDDLREFRDDLRQIGDTFDELEEEIEEFDSDDWENLSDDLDLTRSQTKALVRQFIAIGDACKKAKVTAGYELTVNVTLTGSELDEPEEDEITMYVYKIDGRWITSAGITTLNSFYYYF